MSQVELSVVMACVGDSGSVEAAVRALEDACKGIPTELILVGTNPVEPSTGFPLRSINCPRTILTPERWGLGVREASGAVVGLTTDQMRAHPGWGRLLVDEIRRGAVGIGGPIHLGPGADRTTAAAWLIRFSAFLPGTHHARCEVSDVAGDNAGYETAALMAEPDILAAGVWEVEFHRRFASQGRKLVFHPDVVVTFVGPVTLGSLLRQRFRHARQFGATRVAAFGESRWRVALAAPLVPVVMLARLRRRIPVNAEARRALGRSLPQLLLLVTAWAAGEMAGALTARK